MVKMAEKSGSPAAAAQEQPQQPPFLSSFIAEIVKSPVNLALVGVIAILVYKIVKSRTRPEEPVQEVKKLPKMRRDFAIEELTKYDGKGPDGRILVAVNGSVYDVTRGAKFYGPGESPGPATNNSALAADRTMFFFPRFSSFFPPLLFPHRWFAPSLSFSRILLVVFYLACNLEGVPAMICACKNKIAKVAVINCACSIAPR